MAFTTFSSVGGTGEDMKYKAITLEIPILNKNFQKSFTIKEEKSDFLNLKSKLAGNCLHLSINATLRVSKLSVDENNNK